MTERHDSIILHFIVRVFLMPATFVFGAYVLVHGEISPGGGFQGGAIVASSIILARLTLGRVHARKRFTTRILLWVAGFGLVIYALAGLVPMLLGANFLDYESLPVLWFNEIAQRDRTARSMGVFIVEAGVFFTVASTLVILYDYLTERWQDD